MPHTPNQGADDGSLPPDDDLKVEIYDPQPARTEVDTTQASKRVQRRIHQEVARRHDAERTRDIALEEAKALRKQLDDMRTTSMEVVGSNIDAEIQRLQGEVAEALEAGDSQKASAANTKLAQAAARRANIETLRAQRTAGDGADQPSTAKQVSGSTKAWMNKNPWFNSDRAMTQAALGIHEDLVRKGVQADTPKYFEELDRRIRASFPDAFDDDEIRSTDDGNDFEGDDDIVDLEPDPPPRRQAPVAPAARSGRRDALPPKTVRITEEEANFAKSLGISSVEYAKRKLKRQQEGKIAR